MIRKATIGSFLTQSGEYEFSWDVSLEEGQNKELYISVGANLYFEDQQIMRYVYFPLKDFLKTSKLVSDKNIDFLGFTTPYQSIAKNDYISFPKTEEDPIERKLFAFLLYGNVEYELNGKKPNNNLQAIMWALKETEGEKGSGRI